MIRKLYNSKPIYSIENTLYFLFFADKQSLGKRNAYYDCKEGYIYQWQMKLINLLKNRKDEWTLEAELRMIEENKDVQI